MAEKTSLYALSSGIRQVGRLYDLEEPITKTGSVYRSGGAKAAILKPLQVGAAQAFAIARILRQSQREFLPELILPISVQRARAGYLWHRGNRYLAARILPGRAADYFDDRDVAAAIRLMASWHALTGAMLRHDPQLQKLLAFDPVKCWENRIRELDICRAMASRRSDEFSREYLARWPGFTDQANQALRELQSRAGIAAPAVICYHDWAFHNVLIHGEKAFLIDFDYILADTPVHDRANLLGRYLRLFHWAPRSLLKMLRQFEAYYGWRRGEVGQLRVYLTFPYDYWMIGRQYFLEQQPWSERYFRDQWRRKIVAQEVRFQTLKILERLE